MYLRSIKLKNTGPIKELNLTMPFEGKRPKPLILVGRNGSGKTTLISFIVNALVGLKQQVYEDVEVEKGKVFRVRSTLGINGDENFYFARLDFDRGVSQIEWQLDKTKQKFTDQQSLQALDQSWLRIPANDITYYELPMGELGQQHIVEEMLSRNTHLFFPADRFEPPDWLNSENLSPELQLPEPSRMRGRTQRRIFSRNRLKPTLEWLISVIFDLLVHEHENTTLKNYAGQVHHARRAIPGKAHTVFNSIITVLQRVLCQDQNDLLELGISHRNSRIISATVRREGKLIRSVKDLLSLSAGESALFCLFASIIRDADLSAMEFDAMDQIEGIVLIDEADLHLHLNLQYEVLPNLIALFPKIQFILSVHAPMVALGLEKAIGAESFEIHEMPTGALITPESYSEFLNAFDVYASTKKYQEEIVRRIGDSDLPVLLVEGKTDASLIATAWDKLTDGKALPFKVVACGVEPDPAKREGGAEILRRCTQFLSIVSDQTIIALFDNDYAGYNNFNSLKEKEGFVGGQDNSHKKHVSKLINAILLPIPPERTDFAASAKAMHRYLSIEHYFSDVILEKHGLKGDPIVAGTLVFEIDANSAKKIAFAEKAKTFTPEQFANFAILFDRLKKIAV